MRQAKIFYKDMFAGILTESDTGYSFAYDKSYLTHADSRAISLTLPLQAAPYEQATFFAFFDGLIPEGWLLDIASETWKIPPRDRMGLLLACCKDCIGAVSVIAMEEAL